MADTNNGNITWERRFLALLSCMISGLGLWAWDIRQDTTRNTAAIQEHGVYMRMLQDMVSGAEGRAARLAVLERDIQGCQQRLNGMSQRILTINQRLDQRRPSTPDLAPPKEPFPY